MSYLDVTNVCVIFRLELSGGPSTAALVQKKSVKEKANTANPTNLSLEDFINKLKKERLGKLHCLDVRKLRIVHAFCYINS